MGGLGLQGDLADVAVVAGVGVPGGEGLFDQDVDRDAVLGVHHDQPAVAGGLLHGSQDLAVVAVEDSRIRHEQLEGRHAFGDEAVHLLERGRVDVREDHVEGVVDGAVAVGLGVPGVEPFAQGLAHALDGEVDDGGRAAPGGGAGAGLEGVGGVRSAERHLHVGVAVDAARDDVLARRVDPPVGAPALGGVGSVGGERDDTAALDEHVGVDLVGRGDDQATVDDGATHGISSTRGAPRRPGGLGAGRPPRAVRVRTGPGPVVELPSSPGRRQFDDRPWGGGGQPAACRASARIAAPSSASATVRVSGGAIRSTLVL